jgi:hypothetical protein
MAGPTQLGDDVGDVVVAGDQAVVMLHLEFPVRRHIVIGADARIGEVLEHGTERAANLRRPRGVAWPITAVLGKRVAGGLEDETDRIDQRSIEIEEDGGGARQTRRGREARGVRTGAII